MELAHHLLQPHALRIGHPQSEDEGEQQRRHHPHDRRHGNGEVGGKADRLGRRAGRCAAQHQGEEQPPGGVGAESRDEREAVGQCRREEQQPPGVASQVGDAGGEEPQNEQRDDEFEELPEEGVEGGRNARQPLGEEEAAEDARGDGRQYARQKTEFELHVGGELFVKIGNKSARPSVRRLFRPFRRRFHLFCPSGGAPRWKNRRERLRKNELPGKTEQGRTAGKENGLEAHVRFRPVAERGSIGGGSYRASAGSTSSRQATALSVRG